MTTASEMEPAESYAKDNFHKVVDDIVEIHERKSKDYGIEGDPLANIRASQDFGIPAWVGAILRGNDKMVRIKSFLKKGKLVNESLEDSLLDLAVYSIIALQLYREGKK